MLLSQLYNLDVLILVEFCSPTATYAKGENLL